MVFYYGSPTSIVMQRPSFVTDEVYHLFNRGVEKRTVFLDDRDYFRFIHNMFEFNDTAPAQNLNFYFQSNPSLLQVQRRHRELLVDILSYVLMPNHYHFLVRQKRENGITEFMRKIGTGYTNYFNTRYERVGSLFQGKFKAVHISKEPHYLYLPHYIHLNPLDIVMPEWREQRIKDMQNVLSFLEKYRWSSYLDYIGKKNYPSVIYYRSPTSIVDYKKEIEEWLESFDFEPIRDLLLE